MNECAPDLNLQWVDEFLWTLIIIISLIISFIVLLNYLITSSRKRAINDQKLKHKIQNMNIKKQIDVLREARKLLNLAIKRLTNLPNENHVVNGALRNSADRITEGSFWLDMAENLIRIDDETGSAITDAIKDN